MEINITNEEIKDIAKQRIEKLVDSKVREVLNSMYWQDLSNRIDESVAVVVDRMIAEEKINKIIDKIDKKSIIDNISSKIATQIVESIKGW